MEEQNTRRKGSRGNVWAGLLLLLVGGVLLLRQSGYALPHWLLSWEMILITLGLFIGIRNGFRDFTWLILIAVGFIFISEDIWPGIHLRHYAIPLVIILVGLIFIFSPTRLCGRRRRHFHRGPHGFDRGPGRFAAPNEPGGPQADAGSGSPVPVDMESEPQTPVDEDRTLETRLDIAAIFGGVKKRVISKQFTGGEVVCVFGGAEINLSNADFKSPILLDMVQIFGGTKLIVPANWEVRSEMTAIFGGVDDKRPHVLNASPEKTVILEGVIIFGGVDINSY